MMGSISVGELKGILNDIDDNYEVIMKIHHKYPISKDEGMRGWIAYINGFEVDDDFNEVHFLN